MKNYYIEASTKRKLKTFTLLKIQVLFKNVRSITLTKSK